MRSLISAVTGLALLASPLLASAAETPAPQPAAATAKSSAKPAAKPGVKHVKRISKTVKTPAPQGRKGKSHASHGVVKTPATKK